MATVLPIGDLQLHDAYVPALESGNWTVTINHALDDVTHEPLGATQELIVSAPQFAIDPPEVLAVYPPAGSRGVYGHVLPHVVLAEPMLPWERTMTDKQPWLALLVLSDHEIVGAPNDPTRSQRTTVQSLLKLGGSVLPPRVDVANDIPPATPCAYVELPVSVFAALAPRLGELRFLAHCREANAADKAVSGLGERGLVSLVVANRFPERGAVGAPTGTRNVVHLVSLEGWERYLVDKPPFAGGQTVALTSLHSWTFETVHGPDADFRALAEGFVKSQTIEGERNRDALWLRLAPPAGGDEAHTEVAKRIADGFVPLEYATRTGERTMGWYRGPLTPLATTPPALPGPLPRADAGLIYQPQFGVFDVSLAAAWQAGRAVALADKAFAQRLLDMRRRVDGVADRLHQQLASAAFSANDIASLSADTTVNDELMALLDAQLVADAGTPPAGGAARLGAAASASAPSQISQAALAQFVADPDLQSILVSAVATELDSVATWLAQLLLFTPLPFHYLVADERMLPIESLRFFRVDRAWQAALLDGACSLGAESSRARLTTAMLRDIVHAASHETARVTRARRHGIDPGPRASDIGPASGLLLRSAMVAGWPNLAVRARDASRKLLPALRMDHLSPNVLLCIFDGVPVSVELSEPQEGLRFGVDDDGNAVLRDLVEPNVGRQLELPPVRVYDITGVDQRFARAQGSRVLKLAPDEASGLVQALQVKFAPGTKLGPADFALQMIDAPEAVTFTLNATKADLR